GARHLTAEMLYEEATLAKVPVSLATVYNTLNQLTDAGLLRQVSVDGTKTYFDTKVTAHHHFYLENNHELVDIPDPNLVLSKMPDVPEGYEIARVDMVVRLRRTRSSFRVIFCSPDSGFASTRPGMTASPSLHHFVGVHAPQPLLLDPAV